LHGTAGITTGDSPGYAFSCCALDPVTHRIWAYADDDVWAVDALTGGVAVAKFAHSQAGSTTRGQTRGGWAVYVPGTPRRIFVGMCRRRGQEILVHNLDNNTFSIVGTSPVLQWDPDN
jgi:hypothetical protein